MFKLKLIVSLVANPERFMKIVIATLLVLTLFILLFIALPAAMWKHIPLAKSQQEYDYYIDAARQMHEETGVYVNWQMIMAIDAVIFDHNFRKSSQEHAYSYKPYFIREEIITVTQTCTDEEGEEYDCSYTKTEYYPRDYNETLEMLVSDGKLDFQQIPLVLDKVEYVFEVTDGKIRFIGGADGVHEPGGGDVEIKPVAGRMAWPTDDNITRITSPFGWRIHPITGVRKLHKGMDIGTPMKSNVYAALDGKIIRAGWDSGGGGNIISIQHDNGIVTRYMHLDSFVVRSGSVKAGQLIAKSGNTGGSTGPHLHFQVEVNGEPVDPMNFFR